MNIIEAKQNTFLKRTTEQSDELVKGDLLPIVRGQDYRVDSFLDSYHLHVKVRLKTLEGNHVGDWWVFRPHWDFLDTLPLTALFTLKQPKKGVRGYVWGTLSFSDGFSITASSGAPGFQYSGAHTIRRRGLIPPSDRWRINLPGYHLNTKGIEGWFWHITPDPFLGRSELGLHKDANVLGSAGCIVVPVDVFPSLEDYLKKKQEKQIKLTVRYT